MARGRLIRASEIGEYVYCRRAWWLHHVQGYTPTGRERRERGTALHVRHAWRVRMSGVLAAIGLALLLLAVVMFAL